LITATRSFDLLTTSPVSSAKHHASESRDTMSAITQLTLAALLASTITASACQVEVVDNAAFGWVRSRPNLYANQLWKLGAGVKVIYCGRSAIDDRNIEWRWVAFAYAQEQWPHKGWVSARILSPDVPVITRRAPQEPTFEEGGE
jgi:hypothetical protein